MPNVARVAAADGYQRGLGAFARALTCTQLAEALDAQCLRGDRYRQVQMQMYARCMLDVDADVDVDVDV